MWGRQVRKQADGLILDPETRTLEGSSLHLADCMKTLAPPGLFTEAERRALGRDNPLRLPGRTLPTPDPADSEPGSNQRNAFDNQKKFIFNFNAGSSPYRGLNPGVKMIQYPKFSTEPFSTKSHEAE